LAPDGRERPLAELQARRVAAFCGVGNPEGFRRSLERCGFEIAALRPLADHFAYRPDDVAALESWVSSLDAVAVVCTCKDLVKVGPLWSGKTPLWALASSLEIASGLPEFQAVLERSLSGLSGD